MKKAKKSPVIRKKRKKAVHSPKLITVYSSESTKKKNIFIRIGLFFFRLFRTLAVFLVLSFSWSMIIVIIGLAKMIFLDADVAANAENEQTFYIIIGTFIVVGLFSMFKTWRSWFTNKWLQAFWWAIFPLLYCGVCVLLLSFL